MNCVIFFTLLLSCSVTATKREMRLGSYATNTSTRTKDDSLDVTLTDTQSETQSETDEKTVTESDTVEPSSTSTQTMDISETLRVSRTQTDTQSETDEKTATESGDDSGTMSVSDTQTMDVSGSVTVGTDTLQVTATGTGSRTTTETKSISETKSPVISRSESNTLDRSPNTMSYPSRSLSTDPTDPTDPSATISATHETPTRFRKSLSQATDSFISASESVSLTPNTDTFEYVVVTNTKTDSHATRTMSFKRSISGSSSLSLTANTKSREHTKSKSRTRYYSRTKSRPRTVDAWKGRTPSKTSPTVSRHNTQSISKEHKPITLTMSLSDSGGTMTKSVSDVIMFGVFPRGYASSAATVRSKLMSIYTNLTKSFQVTVVRERPFLVMQMKFDFLNAAVLAKIQKDFLSNRPELMKLGFMELDENLVLASNAGGMTPMPAWAPPDEILPTWLLIFLAIVGITTLAGIYYKCILPYLSRVKKNKEKTTQFEDALTEEMSPSTKKLFPARIVPEDIQPIASAPPPKKIRSLIELGFDCDFAVGCVKVSDMQMLPHISETRLAACEAEARATLRRRPKSHETFAADLLVWFPHVAARANFASILDVYRVRTIADLDQFTNTNMDVLLEMFPLGHQRTIAKVIETILL